MSRLAVNPIFSNGCVIQRDRSVAIWGKAEPGQEIRIEFAGHSQVALANAEGHWRAGLPAVSAGGPYKIEISSPDKHIEITGILAGEVWIAGGQSNMEWPLKFTQGGRHVIEAASDDQIRFFNVLKIVYPGELEETPAKFPLVSAWRPADCANAGEFSAVAYYFALDIRARLGVPVGIIDCTLGGSSASAWVDRARLEQDEDLRSYVDEYDLSVAHLDLADYEAKNRRYRRLAAGLLPILLSRIDPDQESPLFDISRLPARMQKIVDILIKPGPRALFGRPGSLYESMLLTIVPWSCRGIIFYQGEADDCKARIYGKLLRVLIENWRQLWQDPKLPFLFVQLAAYGREGYPEGETYPVLREQQSLVAESVNDCGTAVAMDVGSEIDVHPRRKQPVGQRLALLARSLVYGEAVESSGPVFRSMEIKSPVIELSFDHAGSGLVSHGSELKGFQICGENRKYFPAAASIAGGNVIICSPEVARPAAASYGWANYMEVNLYNAADLPAVPFRTDRYL
jgi:sialate O-acetylesterase